MLPVIDDGAYGYEHVNVAEQRRDPNSLLNWIERIIRMRKEVPEIGWGDFEVLPDPNSPAILTAALRMAQQRRTVRAQPRDAAGRARASPRRIARRDRSAGEPAAEDHSQADDDGKHCMLLERYGYRWYPRRRAGLPAPAQRGLRDAGTDAVTSVKTLFALVRRRSGLVAWRGVQIGPAFLL